MASNQIEKPAAISLSRRSLLQRAGVIALGLAGSSLVSACQSAATPSAPPAGPAGGASPPAGTAPVASSPAAGASPAAGSSPAAAGGARPAGSETPRPGGELSFIVSAEPPSFDAHRETTYAMLHPTAPHYSLLIKYDPDNYPKVTSDAAESWDVSVDGLTYTFKLRDGIVFHDGQPLTSRDVKATYEKIINPPQGVISARKASYAMIAGVEAPDPKTVVFKLKYPSAAFLGLIASPFNHLFSADKLAADPRWYEKNVNGTGAFEFVEYVPGSHWVGKKFTKYFLKDRPYLDGFRATFIRDTSAQVNAVRSGRAEIEFRGFTPTARDDIVRALGDKIVVEESPWIGALIVTINTEKKPFDDVRVRRALNLAIDRWAASEALSKIAILKPVGALVRPGGPFARPESELVKLPGFSRDANAQREEARRLLREAGIPEGFSIVMQNRDVQQPYEPGGVYLLDEWRKIGLNVTQQIKESSAYIADLRNGNYDIALDFTNEYADDPDVLLPKYVSASKSSLNYGRYNDETVDELYDKQSRETDPAKRNQLVWQIEDRVVGEQAYVIPLLWYYRIIPYSPRLHGFKVLPSHYVNQDLVNVWLSPE